MIGYGYWGPNLVRNFSEAPGSRVVAVSDLRGDRLRQAEDRYPGALATADPRELIDNASVDAVAIATPVSTHFDLALRALEAGKHVLVAKPMTNTSGEAQRLVEEAARRGLVLMVDHTFVYAGAVRKIHELLSRGELGDIYYYDSVRVNLGLFQHDVNVIWDLAVHDLSIMDYVLASRPRAVSAVGMSHVAGGTENIAYLTLFFEGRFMAHVHVNWLAPVKVRRTLIGGSRKMIVYDDLEPSEKVKLYDSGITVQNGTDAVYRMLIDYRVGDMWAPKISRAESLQVEAVEFLDCIRSGARPASDGESGLRLVRLLEAASASMAKRGEIVELPS